MESEKKVRDQVSALVYLLPCLGFIINKDKSILQSAQSVEFLGFIVNTVMMELSLPEKKVKKIWAESMKLVKVRQVSAHALSRLTGKINAANQVIPPAPLFYRNLQMDLTVALRASNQDYESSPTLSIDCNVELLWWDTRMSKWNGKSILTIEPEMVAESNASNQGRGAS